MITTFWLSYIVLFGILLPAVTLAIELVTHMCAGTFFDPLPTWGHVFLVAWGPIANAWTVWTVRRSSRALPWVWRANAVAMAVALFYVFQFLFITPLAFVMIIALGWGLLPLAPLFSFLAAWRLRSILKQSLPESSREPMRWWIGFGIGFALLGLLAVPQGLTRSLEHLAVADDPAKAAQGLKWLRAVGHQETLLRDCYGTPRGEGSDPFREWFGEGTVGTEEARGLYYRVTGQVFNSVPPPQSRHHGRGWDFLDEFEWDPAVGGDTVAGVVKGLTLRESRLDAVVSPDDAWGYVEWIMEFQNTNWQQREARAQIALPPGAVVSRLTLWVNGEEHEAAFAGRAQTKAAYREVAVVQRRDPVLVTTSGPDQVLLQCFPIPANGTMKVRIGITLPLALGKLDEAVWQWPAFAERNFKLASTFTHSVWLETPQSPIELTKPFSQQMTATNSYAIRAELPDAALVGGQAVIRLRRDSSKSEAQVPDYAGSDRGVIRQWIETLPAVLPARIVAVVDGSAPMQRHAKDIADVLADLQGKTELVMFVTDDEQPDGVDSNMTPAGLRGRRFRGGHDNVPALVQAWEKAVEKPGSVILWIHAAQPVVIHPLGPLSQIIDRSDAPASPPVVNLTVNAGTDRIAEALDRLPRFGTLLRIGNVGQRLERLTGLWLGNFPTILVHRERSVVPEDASPGRSAAKHVVRLWANEAVAKLISQRRVNDAINLAAAHQLVTPVTGAVVLETVEQYQRAGLTPTDPAKVPSAIVPEPAVWAMAVVGAALLGLRWALTRRREIRNRLRFGI